MIDRRMLIAGAAALGLSGPLRAATPSFVSKRPKLADRRYTSRAVEAEIARVTAKIGRASCRERVCDSV